MSDKTKIEWADMTWNPWRGCTKVSPGCANCYAESLSKRNPAVLGEWGRGKPRVRGSKSNLSLPLKWEKLAAKGRFVECLVCGRREFRKWDDSRLRGGLMSCTNIESGCVYLTETDSAPVRPRVFCLSLGDWLDDEVPIEWLVNLLEVIHATPHLDWLLLTKRPENWRCRIDAAFQFGELKSSRHFDFLDWLGAWSQLEPGTETVPSNIWIGTSVEDQKRADERIPELLKIPARVRFLSCEPLLGPVDLSNVTHRSDCVSMLGKRSMEGIHWMIIGGESGGGARPCALEWIDDLRRQCSAAEVACFVKQLGSTPYVENANLWESEFLERPIFGDPPGKKYPFAAAGVKLRDRKGGDWEEWPDELLVRQFPNTEGLATAKPLSARDCSQAPE